MDHVDLVERLIPNPLQTLVIETPTGELVLVDTARIPMPGDTVLNGDNTFTSYEAGLRVSGVAYCSIRFL